MNQVVEAILKVKAVDLLAPALIRRLYVEPKPDAGAILEMEPEIEAALEQAREVAQKSERMVKECLELRAIPAPEPPPGF